jgi:hypothetical protein
MRKYGLQAVAIGIPAILVLLVVTASFGPAAGGSPAAQRACVGVLDDCIKKCQVGATQCTEGCMSKAETCMADYDKAHPARIIGAPKNKLKLKVVAPTPPPGLLDDPASEPSSTTRDAGSGLATGRRKYEPTR